MVRKARREGGMGGGGGGGERERERESSSVGDLLLTRSQVNCLKQTARVCRKRQKAFLHARYYWPVIALSLSLSLSLSLPLSPSPPPLSLSLPSSLPPCSPPSPPPPAVSLSFGRQHQHISSNITTRCVR